MLNVLWYAQPYRVFLTNITTGLDSINRLDTLVNRAKELGLNGIAITDHDNLCQAIKINDYQKQLQASNDPFILALGNEIYLIDKYEDDDNNKQQYYHFILIAKDEIGYKALVELSSCAWYRSSILRSKRRVPTEKSDIEEVMQWAKGHVIASTACLGGELPYLVLNNKQEEAERFLNWCVAQFGKENFYIELQPSDSAEQVLFNRAALSKWHENYKFIISTDAHYLDEKDFSIFEAFLRSDEKNKRREVKEYYTFARLMGEEEIFNLMRQMNIPDEITRECLDNTIEVSKQFELFDLAQTQKIPSVPLQEIELTIPADKLEEAIKYPTISWALNDEEIGTRYCIKYCLNSLYKKDLWSERYLDRLEEEFEVHKYQSDELNSNFFNYVNCCQWLENLAWSIDCAVGPGRGSAGGCLINFLMDVTQIDPIQYDLKFWRYLNKVRTSPLDIDCDYQPSKKADLYAAIRKVRGELGMSQVATYRTLTLKAAIGNAGRGYRSKDFPTGLDPDIISYISSLIEVKRGFVASLEQTLEGDAEQEFKRNDSFIKECKNYPGLLEIIEMVEGLIVGSSTHASAVVLFDDQDRFLDHSPLMRAPNGEICTALDLHTIEKAGCFKLDILWLSTLDIQATTFKLLQRDGVIDPSLSLRQCFEKYIDVNKIDYNDPEIWKHLFNNDVLDVFQFNAASGRRGVLAMNPTSLEEMTFLNAAIRLVTPEGEESQIERAIRLKANMADFEKELIINHVSDERRQILHEELDKFNGCCAGQETFMTLSQRLVGFSLKEADALRKTVAKKKVEEVARQRELFISKGVENGCSQEEAEYLWNICVEPSKSYSFNYAHGTVYSMIGVQCLLLGGILFHPIYWQTACLLQRSGSLDGKSSDYNKIAKAVSFLSKLGVKIAPVNINKSENDFILDRDNNTIYFGFSGVKGLKTAVIDKIFATRPYDSVFDFIVKTGADIGSITTLIKAGAFNEFGPKEGHIWDLARFKADQKDKLNGQNLAMIAREGFWPQTTPELVDALHCFNFTQYLKLNLKKAPEADDYGLKEYFWLDERAKDYLDRIGYEYDGDYLLKTSWKAYYDLMMRPIKEYLAANQNEMLTTVNNSIITAWKEKYFPSTETFSQWEIATLGLCFDEHPMKNLVNVANFEDLPSSPEIASIYPAKGRNIPLYKLTMIAGVVIAKDKLHSSFTLLTANGPVEVKLRKQEFASYDCQISKKLLDGKKKIIEKSWLNRGSMILVHGMRQDDIFVGKYYKNSPMKHTIYRITRILDTGKVEVQKERASGTKEECKDDENE